MEAIDANQEAFTQLALCVQNPLGSHVRNLNLEDVASAFRKLVIYYY